MFGAIYDGFEKKLKSEFEARGVSVVRQYAASGIVNQIPIIVVECSDFWLSKDQPASGINYVVTRWQIRHMLSKKEKGIEAIARDMGLKIMLMFSNHVFENYTFPAKFVGSVDDNIDFDLPYESWVTQFEVTMGVGESDYDGLVFHFNDKTGGEDAEG